MRCNHDVWRCACTKRAAEVSVGRSAGPRRAFGGDRSSSQGTGGRHCRSAQNPASKSRSNCCAKIPAPRKNSGTNNRIYRATLWNRSQQIDSNCHFEQIENSRTDRIFKRGLVPDLTWVKQITTRKPCADPATGWTLLAIAAEGQIVSVTGYQTPGIAVFHESDLESGADRGMWAVIRCRRPAPFGSDHIAPVPLRLRVSGKQIAGRSSYKRHAGVCRTQGRRAAFAAVGQARPKQHGLV
jgi:hypothetical protein